MFKKNTEIKGTENVHLLGHSTFDQENMRSCNVISAHFFNVVPAIIPVPFGFCMFIGSIFYF